MDLKIHIKAFFWFTGMRCAQKLADRGDWTLGEYLINE
jgi:hypothetical protein